MDFAAKKMSDLDFHCAKQFRIIIDRVDTAIQAMGLPLAIVDEPHRIFLRAQVLMYLAANLLEDSVEKCPEGMKEDFTKMKDRWVQHYFYERYLGEKK